jgi:type IV secretory pathway protease TraF
MNETPEDSPPAFPCGEPSEAGGPAAGPSVRPFRPHRLGLPKLQVRSQCARDGLWRVEVAEESMYPALAPGDWLLLDPTTLRWPRRGSVVVFREPDSGILAIKRVAAVPGDRIRIAAGILHLGPDEAWMLGDNVAPSVDSRRYGPVSLDALMGRAWLRYGPLNRLGRIPRRATLTLDR